MVKERNAFQYYLFLTGVLASIFAVSAATEASVWVSGSSVANNLGVYGTKGVPDPNNVPGARYSSISWIDGSGDLWLFGGYGYVPSSDPIPPKGDLSDLWRFDGTSWTWVSGPNEIDQWPPYPPIGVFSSSYEPGARRGSVCWMDGSGDLWLFGGYYEHYDWRLNDLWIRSGTLSQWAYMGGGENRPGVYGTKGIPNPANVPGSREDSVSWIDSSDDLWLFGGYGYDSSSSGYLSDLWRFDGTNWTWVSGPSIKDQPGVYGTKGIPDPNNVPGARRASISWIDSSGDLWLFGGYGYDSSSIGQLNDLWRFDGTNWTWVSGLSIKDQPGVYGTKGVPDPNNVPGARYSSVSWIDGRGDLRLFGGYGYDSNSLGDLSDLWRFDGTNWTWVSGLSIKDQPGVYGTKGVYDPNNVPGARRGSVSWIDSSDDLWLFGGFGCSSSLWGFLNDLWKYPLCANSPAEDINGDCIVDFIDFSIMANHWLQDTRYH